MVGSSIRLACARALGFASTRVLRDVLRRPAANFPGKVGLYADPQLIGHLRPRLREGSVVVVGTNGKTTVTNLIADALEAAGKTVACNRTGANLDSGVATALLHAKGADWGVFECDELWLVHVLAQLEPRFVVLLNLFRDQLDRAGEIEHVRQGIVSALRSSPQSVLVFNADDPNCQAVADSVANARVAFGIADDLGLPQNTVADSGLCQRCDVQLSYAWHQYGQLGKYQCPKCGFGRSELDYAAIDVRLGPHGSSFAVAKRAVPEACGASSGGGAGVARADEGEYAVAAGGALVARADEGEYAAIGSGMLAKCAGEGEGAVAGGGAPVKRADEGEGATTGGGEGVARGDGGAGAEAMRLSTSLAGPYTVYNLLAASVAADCCGVAPTCVEQAARAFSPGNGRLQAYDIAGHRVLLNLAKNPTGLNQNLRIVMADAGPKAVAFFINDKEADGHDVSWLWDADFQELAVGGDLMVCAGGMRRNDMQVRLKYAGVDAQLVSDARDFAGKALAALPKANLYLIANYTALPAVKAELDRMGDGREAPRVQPGMSLSPDRACASPGAAAAACASTPGGAVAGRALAGGGERRAHRDGNADTAATATCADAPGSAPAGCAPAGGTKCRAQGYGDADVAASGVCAGAAPGNTPAGRALAGGSARDVADDPCGAGAHGLELVIVHVYPELLNLYGDGGNVEVLAERVRRRGIGVAVQDMRQGQALDFAQADIVFMGGGPDREQRLASAGLAELAGQLRAYVEDGGVLLAICGGYQILGYEWVSGDEAIPGLGIVDITTKRAPGDSRNRLVGNIALQSPLASHPVIGYENHAGRTYLGPTCQPFGSVIGTCGFGNNGADGADGVVYRNVVGTYLHGPVLSKNPEVADWLIARALERRVAKTGCCAPQLAPLDDAAECAANDFMCRKLGVGKARLRARSAADEA